MRGLHKAATVASVVLGGAALSSAQVDYWGSECFDPENTTPISTDFGTTGIGSQYQVVLFGTSGTVTYGGGDGDPFPTPFCYVNAQTLNAVGRFVMGLGPRGSDLTSFDNNMATTMSFPYPVGAYNYICLIRNNPDGTVTKTRFGDGGFSLIFSGASDRYTVIEGTVDGVLCHLRIDLVADAQRWGWRFVQQGTAPAPGTTYELWVGMSPCLKTFFASDPATGATQSGWGFWENITSPNSIKDVYQSAPGLPPLVINKRFNRDTDPVGFPQTMEFGFGQTSFYGIRAENGPTEETTDPVTGVSDAAQAYEVAVGNGATAPNLLASNGQGIEGGFVVDPAGNDETMPDFMFDDASIHSPNGLGAPIQFLQKFRIPTFGSTPKPKDAPDDLALYYRTTWSFARYSKPMSVMIDMPRLIATDPQNANNLIPQPLPAGLPRGQFDVVLHVDNIRGFTGAETLFPLNNVKATISLPPGIEFVDPTEKVTKEIATVPPKQIRTLSWRCRATAATVGVAPVKIDISEVTGAKTSVSGNFVIAATPRLDVANGISMVSFPWAFKDTSFDAIFGLTAPTDYRIFSWNADQQMYAEASSAERTVGYFMVSPQARDGHVLNGATAPADIATGIRTIQLRPGWNMVGDPYPYAFPLGQIVGVSGAEPNQSYSWQDLVNKSYVDPAIIYFDQSANGGAGAYEFVSGLDAPVRTTKGFWIHVPTAQPLTLRLPPVFINYLPDSSRSVDPWKQTERQWRLQLSVRNGDGADPLAYVGAAATAADARKLTIHKPPMTPVQKVEIAVVDPNDPLRKTTLAQALQANGTRQEWTVRVYTKNAGATTLTWPNMSTVPKGIRFRVIDSSANIVRDMRQSAGYTFQANADSTRELKITAEPSTSGRAVIGNVVVSRPAGRADDKTAPFTIAYTLSNDANTTVRIISGAGKEVFTLARGRADRSGENTVTWNLKDNADRSVAPGVYRVEIIAETNDGERVRKIVPVNVVR